MAEDPVTKDLGDQPGGKFWFIDTMPGVTKGNMWSFLVMSFSTIGLLTFISATTTYVLTVNLGVPVAEQGSITGDLVVITEIAQILIFGVVGVLSDRVGRRQILAFGMLGMGTAYMMYPFAESIGELTVYRFIYALGLGSATGMIGTIAADYPQENCRARLLAFGGVLNGLGVIVVTLFLGSLPEVLVNAGVEQIAAGRITNSIAFIACALSAIVAMFGLQKGTPGAQEERPPMMELMKSGITEAQKNPRIALSYAAAFVARADLVIIGTFTVLWGNVAGIQAGLEPAEALSVGIRLFVTASTAALIWLPILGYLVDGLNRVTSLAICMTLMALGFSAMAFVGDPLELSVLPLFVLLGIGQISAFLGAQTLVGTEAPKLKRGAVVGIFNKSGAIGILVLSSIGGRLFDSIAPAAPFVLVGICGGVVAVLAVIVRMKSPGYIPKRKSKA
ncbi:MAG: MFS transporter [Gammaproteobacteria bacterium]|nr:MFS transporter [Gammaproteobacteria bacterium]